MRKKIAGFVVLFFLATAVRIASGQDDIQDMQKMNSKILELQEQILEMQKKHEAEINSLKEQINQLSDDIVKQKDEDELVALRQLAKSKTEEKAVPEEKYEEKIFESGSLNLQALNPEISVTGDFEK